MSGGLRSKRQLRDDAGRVEEVDRSEDRVVNRADHLHVFRFGAQLSFGQSIKISSLERELGSSRIGGEFGPRRTPRCLLRRRRGTCSYTGRPPSLGRRRPPPRPLLKTAGATYAILSFVEWNPAVFRPPRSAAACRNRPGPASSGHGSNAACGRCIGSDSGRSRLGLR